MDMIMCRLCRRVTVISRPILKQYNITRIRRHFFSRKLYIFPLKICTRNLIGLRSPVGHRVGERRKRRINNNKNV